MSNAELIMKYKCPLCPMRYPEMTPNGKCVYHDVELIDLKQTLSSVELQWHKETFDAFPSVLAHEYYRLYQLCCSDNIYGTILQLKDVIEATVKLVVLSISAWAKAHDIAGRKESYEKELANEELSFGDWFTLNNLIRNFYTSKKYRGIQPPETLKALMLAVSDWEEKNHFTHWRNETIGHGALALEDDPEIYLETAEKINALSVFYEQHDSEFKSIHITSEGLSLIGKANARDLPVAVGDHCCAEVNGDSFSLVPYVLHVNAGIYFYDEYADKKQQRLILNSRVYFVTTIDPLAATEWYPRQSTYPCAV